MAHWMLGVYSFNTMVRATFAHFAEAMRTADVNVNGLRARLTNRTAGLAVKSKTFNFGAQSAQYVPN